MVEGVDALTRLTDAVKAKRDGFPSLAEHMLAIVRARRDNVTDPRLKRAPHGLNENDPSLGGFLVQDSYARDLVGFAYEESILASLCDHRTTLFPLSSVNAPGIDETSRQDGSRYGGALSYWSVEADNVNPTLPRFKNLNFSARKLIAIAYGTGELMQDVPMLDAHLRRVFAAEMGFKIDASILLGSGAGVPQGILNSSALIAVPASGQGPAITVENVTAMWKRLPTPSRRRAFWLIGEETEEQ